MNPYYDNEMHEMHPQYDILKKHIERSIQDIFLDSLKNKSDKLVLAFENVEQINSFGDRILKYWETLEDYQKCKDIVDLIKKLKDDWRNLAVNMDLDRGFMLSDLFNKTNDNEGLL